MCHSFFCAEKIPFIKKRRSKKSFPFRDVCSLGFKVYVAFIIEVCVRRISKNDEKKKKKKKKCTR